jgi:hypothetical protein
MIDLYDLYQSFKSYVNTYVGGWFRPQSDFAAASNDISYELFDKWTRMAEKSQEAKDNLFPFLLSKNLMVKKSGAYGMFDPPEGYNKFGAARIIVAGNTCVPDKDVNEGKCSNGDFKTDTELAEDYYNTVKQINVRMIENQKWGSFIVHATKGPSVEKERIGIRQINGQFQVAPRDVSVVVVDYYRLPKIATFKYTTTPGNIDTGAGDDIVYDKSSQPLEWPGNLRDEFLINLGERYGLFTRDEFLGRAIAQQKQTA